MKIHTKGGVTPVDDVWKQLYERWTCHEKKKDVQIAYLIAVIDVGALFSCFYRSGQRGFGMSCQTKGTTKL